MILLIDNYDSFTWNLVHYLAEAGAEVVVRRNDSLSVDEALAMAPDGIVISPGPCDPAQAGICLDLIRAAADKAIPLFGVCLGHQAIGEAFGARLLNTAAVHHGVATPVHVTTPDEPLYAGIPATFDAGRYHSWIVDSLDFPACLEITAIDDENRIMSLRHRHLDVRGVQFHPESVLTPEGEKIIANWLGL